MRLLGIDFGGTRIGLATADDAHGIPSPLPVLMASGTLAKDAAAIAAIAKKQEAELAVVGLPLNEDGSDSKMARICRMLGTQIEAQGLKVAYVDESFTSAESEAALGAMGMKASQVRRQVDGDAAARIVLRYMEGRFA